jgi:hypothetical protein
MNGQNETHSADINTTHSAHMECVVLMSKNELYNESQLVFREGQQWKEMQENRSNLKKLMVL